MIDEVVMLRHGRTNYNLNRRLQGQIDVPLDIVGQWQADQSGLALAGRYYWAKVARLAAHPEYIAQPGPDAAERTSIDEYREAPAARRRMVVRSSDLFRALQTAHAFADLLGLDVIPDARLRERSFGAWEGMTREEIRESDAAAYDSWKNRTGGELAYGVESRRALGARGVKALLDIIADPRYADDVPTTLMIVGHGSWIVATISELLGIDPDAMDALGAMRNAHWSRLRVRYTVNGRAVDPPMWELLEHNHGPAIAAEGDWENGPADLHGPHMPEWTPITW
ncbi:histidine phosphatase family protein [Bifidobacterium sp. MA2]|uniref:Histidine phosphatase family protein n=1 Tax=Bifidobacterium santillanense TaxID=2809028 RepID=A0ABS5UQU2_9BIFI|nr:histidine phosphatase family protein [Bifidobacterium santillanense]MBT1173358.1 histidine phosphatase family protein [Bifidobacterium santillanense]